MNAHLHPPGLTTAAWVLLALAAAAALVDWGAVATRRRAVEYAAKPLTIALIAAVAIALDPSDGLRRAYVVTALLFSLAGDTFLMLPGAEDVPADDPTTAAAGRARPAPEPRHPGPDWFDPFVFGLAAFLLAHLNYIAAFRVGGPGLGRVVPAAAVVAVVAVPLGTIITRSLVARGREPLRRPVIVYIAALGGMAASALATGNLLAAGGATAFLLSDTTLAWNRFVRPIRGAPVIVAVTYHVAQALLAVSLVR